MAKWCETMLSIFLISLTFTSVTNAQTDLYLMEAPSNGVVRPIAGNAAIMYVGTLGASDSFAFATEDENGISFVDVTLDSEVGVTHIVSTDFGGAVALGAISFALVSEKSEGETAATPPTNGGENDAKEDEKDKPYVVIIYVDQPGEGGDRDPYEGGLLRPLDVGHTFVEIVNGETGESTTIGFYPDPADPDADGVGKGDPEDPGQIVDDSGHDWDVKAEFEITKEQYEELMEQIEKDRKDPPDYNLNEFNCTDYVLELLADIGIKIDSEEGTWPGGGGNNPGDLGEDLVQDHDGVRKPEPDGGESEGTSGK